MYAYQTTIGADGAHRTELAPANRSDHGKSPTIDYDRRRNRAIAGACEESSPLKYSQNALFAPHTRLSNNAISAKLS